MCSLAGFFFHKLSNRLNEQHVEGCMDMFTNDESGVEWWTAGRVVHSLQEVFQKMPRVACWSAIWKEGRRGSHGAFGCTVSGQEYGALMEPADVLQFFVCF